MSKLNDLMQSEKEMREAIDRMLADEDYKGIRCIYFILLGRAENQQQEFQEGTD
jgi:23S rRNA maturation-related 3'-5' exoribonuclease YhaM